MLLTDLKIPCLKGCRHIKPLRLRYWRLNGSTVHKTFRFPAQTIPNCTYVPSRVHTTNSSIVSSVRNTDIYEFMYLCTFEYMAVSKCGNQKAQQDKNIFIYSYLKYSSLFSCSLLRTSVPAYKCEGTHNVRYPF